MGDLKQRLRKPDFWTAHTHGGGSLSDEVEAAPFQAADAIEALEAQLAEAREVVAVCEITLRLDRERMERNGMSAEQNAAAHLHCRAYLQQKEPDQ